MSVLILAVFCAVMQTGPRHTADSAARTANQVRQKPGQDKRQPAALPLNDPVNSNPSDQAGTKPSQQNAEQPVRVTELPSVSVHRDWADWVLWAMSGILSVVGFIGVCVAIKTLRVLRIQATMMARQTAHIARQALSMRRQTTHLKNSVEAANRTAGILQDTAERQLRAYVLVDSALLKFPNPAVPEVQVHVKNFGQTPAYDFRMWIGLYIGDFPLRAVLPEAPPIIQTAEECLAPGRVSIMVIERNPPVEANLVHLLGTVQGTIWVYGEMTYSDAFGRKRSSKYRLFSGGYIGPRAIKNPDGTLKGYLMNPDTEGNECD